jgi:enoyl-CoA hydratase/carnithine racemase
VALRVEVDNPGGVAAIVTMTSPDGRNAIGPADARALRDAILHASKSGAATVILRGDRAFCAGGDLPSIAATASASVDAVRTDIYESFQGVVRALHGCALPVIAAIDGPAVGLGMDIALACDMRFIGADGWMQQGWARAGLITGTGGVAFVERLHPGLSWRLIAEQPRLRRDECERLGIGESADSAFAAAQERSVKLAALPTNALAGYVELHRTRNWPADQFFDRCAEIQAGLLHSDEFQDFAAKFGRAST